MDASDNIVFLKTYETMAEANYDMLILEENSIPCFLSDSNIVQLYPMFSSPFGGIKLNVFEKDKEKALHILKEIHSNENE